MATKTASEVGTFVRVSIVIGTIAALLGGCGDAPRRAPLVCVNDYRRCNTSALNNCTSGDVINALEAADCIEAQAQACVVEFRHCTEVRHELANKGIRL